MCAPRCADKYQSSYVMKILNIKHILKKHYLSWLKCFMCEPWYAGKNMVVKTRFLFMCTEYCFWRSCLLSIKHIWYGYHLEILNLKQKKHDASTYLEISPREVLVRLQGQGCHAGSEGGCSFYGEHVIDDVDNDGDDGVEDDVRDDNRPQGVKLLSKLWGL